VFPDNKKVVTSTCVLKVQKNIKNMNVTILYFARCFTLEAIKVINDSNGVLFALVDFPWNDESYNHIHGGTR
ncbi:MAG: hypothetical protein K2G63_07395, partial [Oscillospiraceae bacterium]|nr:hypothetical protein [Oscillospiraceae bacterium]